jgi:hypothetical protein
MNSKNFMTAGIAGGVVCFFLGWLVYGILLADYMTSNAPAQMAGMMRSEADMVWWALILGNLLSAFLLSYIFTRVGHVNTPAAGAKTGALIGLFMAGSFDLTMYGTMNMMTMNCVWVDILASTTIMAIVGAVVAWVVGKATA